MQVLLWAIAPTLQELQPVPQILSLQHLREKLMNGLMGL